MEKKLHVDIKIYSWLKQRLCMCAWERNIQVSNSVKIQSDMTRSMKTSVKFYPNV